MVKQIEIQEMKEKRHRTSFLNLKYVAAGTLLLTMFNYGCAIMPLTKKEVAEYHQSMREYPNQMGFYDQLLKSGGRTAIMYKEINNPANWGDLNSELVKSRKHFGILERFKRKLTGNSITREELEIMLQNF